MSPERMFNSVHEVHASIDRAISSSDKVKDKKSLSEDIPYSRVSQDFLDQNTYDPGSYDCLPVLEDEVICTAEGDQRHAIPLADEQEGKVKSDADDFQHPLPLKDIVDNIKYKNFPLVGRERVIIAIKYAKELDLTKKRYWNPDIRGDYRMVHPNDPDYYDLMPDDLRQELDEIPVAFYSSYLLQHGSYKIQLEELEDENS
jgi:hypothetical protein